MNKFLMGTTALIGVAAFTAPALAAEKIQLELRGYHVGAISYTDVDFISFLDIAGGPGPILVDDSNYNEINFGSDSEIHFRGSTTLDNGLQVSFRAELELEDDSDVDGDADQIDEVYIQFDGGFGRVQFGQNDGAMYQQHIAAPNAFVGHGVNQPDIQLDPFSPFAGNFINTFGTASDDNIKITYFTPSMNGLQFGASYTPNPCKNDTGYAGCVFEDFARNFWEISGTWQGDLDNISIGLSAGFGSGESGGSSEEPQEWTVGGQVGFAGLTVGGSYKDTNLTGDSHWDETHWDAGASYETGPWNVSVTYGTMEAEHGIVAGEPLAVLIEQESWIGGVTYMYGPGMQIGAGVQTMDSEGVILSPDLFSLHTLEGTSFFIENVISF